MTREELFGYLEAKPGAAEERPFDMVTPVFKVMGKMFALVSDTTPLQLNLKCDPDEALFLRDQYASVIPGYHMNKRHWNTVVLDGSVPAAELYRMIDSSYQLVVAGLTRKQRLALSQLDEHD